MTSTESTDRGVSRRRIIQGAAWATPAIVVATAAPAMANGSTTSAPSVVSASLTAALSGGVTLSRVDNNSQYAVKTLQIVVRVNKTVANGANHNPVTATVANGSWSLSINQNPTGASQAAHASYAYVTFTYTGSVLNNTDAAPIGWSIGGASLAGAQVSGTYGIAGGATIGSFGPLVIFGVV